MPRRNRQQATRDTSVDLTAEALARLNLDSSDGTVSLFTPATQSERAWSDHTRESNSAYADSVAQYYVRDMQQFVQAGSQHRVLFYQALLMQFNSVTQCKKLLRMVHISITEYLDAMRRGQSASVVTRYASKHDLRLAIMLKDAKICKLGKAKAEMMQPFLVEIYNFGKKAMRANEPPVQSVVHGTPPPPSPLNEKRGAADERVAALLSPELDDVGRPFDDGTFGPPSTLDVFLGRDRRARRRADPVIWSRGWRPFVESLSRRIGGIFTKRFIICLLLGQLLSLAITSTSVTTTELIDRQWSMPTFQTFFLYAILALVYTPYTIYAYGISAYAEMIMSWQTIAYILLALVDVEANYAVLKAFTYSDLLSCMLLDAWAVPACMIFAFVLVRARYHWSQILGVIVCIGGLGLLVTSDWHTDKVEQGKNKVLGDLLMLAGATGYGLSNALVEMYVRQRPMYEVMGQLGLWGCFVNAVQSAAAERKVFATVPWSVPVIGLLVAYTSGMLVLYTLAPIVYRLASSPFANISILTSDFYGLLFGVVLYKYKPYWLYFVAFVLILVGLVIYFSVARPEDSGALEIRARGKSQLQQRGGSGGQRLGAIKVES
ncbi:hypothetical protein OIV83_004322 [Microbotryomycetes sp. JL201]|nr:hypothetical protein OIV83_004304 [Microbotryomycetes sp. JL201]KAK4049175.1 hypothetical protein OIV83_004322 [Microbotryomycetes sp. JL201]